MVFPALDKGQKVISTGSNARRAYYVCSKYAGVGCGKPALKSVVKAYLGAFVQCVSPKYDAVLGGRTPAPDASVILGGL